MPVIVGIDVGGTFTDVVLQREDNGFLKVIKVPSTPSDLVVGLIDGLKALQIDFEDIGLIIHGSTVATNAVLEPPRPPWLAGAIAGVGTPSNGMAPPCCGALAPEPMISRSRNSSCAD